LYFFLQLIIYVNTQFSKSSFQPVPLNSPFVKTLHVNGSHWITVSNSSSGCGSSSSCYKDCIKIYDSASPSVVCLEVQTMVCSIMKPKSSTLTFDVVNVQSQINSYDCGMFAIAFATEIAHGNTPGLMHFYFRERRRHFIKCFETNHISQFSCKRRRRIPLGSSIKIFIQQPIYCFCRTVNDVNKSMIRCDFCKDWFHLKF